jgi:hypothetical protein
MPWHVCGNARADELADMTAIDVKRRLALLFEERGLARAAGLGEDPAYMADLEDEIRTTSAAWVGAALTEIASMRGMLSGPQVG